MKIWHVEVIEEESFWGFNIDWRETLQGFDAG
jgi:hypothetical protein